MPELSLWGSGLLNEALMIGCTNDGVRPIVARLEECETVETVGRLRIIKYGHIIGGVAPFGYAQLKIKSFTIPMGTFPHMGGEVEVSVEVAQDEYTPITVPSVPGGQSWGLSVENAQGGYALTGVFRDHTGRIQWNRQYFTSPSVGAIVADMDYFEILEGWKPSLFFHVATWGFAK